MGYGYGSGYRYPGYGYRYGRYPGPEREDPYKKSLTLKQSKPSQDK